MNDDENNKEKQGSEIKICHTCGEVISAAVKKCPFCQSGQSKLDSSRIFPMIAFLLSLGLSYFFYNLTLYEDFQEYRDSIEVIKSEMDYENSDKWEPAISVKGILNNNSSISWESPYMEVRFYDAHDKLIDTIVDKDSSHIIPEKKRSSFHIRGVPDKPPAMYNSHKIFIKEAKELRKSIWF